MDETVSVSNPHQISTVAVLELGIEHGLAQAARDVVHNKHFIDKMADTNGGAMLARDLHAGGYGAHEPLAFLSKILPFFSESERSETTIPVLVPTAHTLGCSWRWRRHATSPGEFDPLIKTLTDADALLAGTLNSASYHWIKPLGIIAPSEGKNRTDFLRGEGVELIPANVWEHTYPAAERLQIYEIEDGAFKETWAVLDGRWVQKVENPSWTNPLMQAYGVPVQQRWPRQFPSPKQVVLAMFERPGTTSPMGHPDHDYAPFVDLKTLEAISQYQTEEVRCAVLELKDIQIDRRIWACITTSFILGFLIWTLAPSAWTPLQGLAGVFVGIGLGGLAIFLKGVVTTDRRNLSNQIRLPLDRAPKSPKHIARRLLG